jgi:hypothetical protein
VAAAAGPGSDKINNRIRGRIYDIFIRIRIHEIIIRIRNLRRVAVAITWCFMLRTRLLWARLLGNRAPDEYVGFRIPLYGANLY